MQPFYRPSHMLFVGGICYFFGAIRIKDWSVDNWRQHLLTIPSDCRPQHTLTFAVNQHDSTHTIDVSMDSINHNIHWICFWNYFLLFSSFRSFNPSSIHRLMLLFLSFFFFHSLFHSYFLSFSFVPFFCIGVTTGRNTERLNEKRATADSMSDSDSPLVWSLFLCGEDRQEDNGATTWRGTATGQGAPVRGARRRGARWMAEEHRRRGQGDGRAKIRSRGVKLKAGRGVSRGAATRADGAPGTGPWDGRARGVGVERVRINCQ